MLAVTVAVRSVLGRHQALNFHVRDLRAGTPDDGQTGRKELAAAKPRMDEKISVHPSLRRKAR